MRDTRGISLAEQMIYIDGKLLPKSEAHVSVFDHGFLYGDGVFEGIRAYNSVIFKLDEHLERLYASAKTLMLEVPLTRDQMREAIISTLKANGLRDAYIRLIVTRGVGDLGLDPRKCPKSSVIIIAGTISLMAKETVERGIKTLITWVRRDPIDGTSHEVKSMNYLNSILAKIEANNFGVDEAIFLNHQGYVCEGTAENVFIVKRGRLITPPTYTGALAGITQQAVIEVASRAGIPVEVRPMSASEVFNADEVFFTGTAAEIIPVTMVNGRTIGDGKPGKTTLKLRGMFMEYALDPSNGTRY